ncbi:hypothetical protein BDR26DRAFT_863554 [Obelidium mucronatum]|nr:hypothetical protein BDR26DRAFT_863554 [Obelidium mucronatum]
MPNIEHTVLEDSIRAQVNCAICTTAPFKYTCPKCFLQYCSLACYKHQTHSQCSESFYKDNIQQEMEAKKAGESAAARYYTGMEGAGRDKSDENMKRKMQHLLRRFERGELGVLSQPHELSREEMDDIDDDAVEDDLDALQEKLGELDIDSMTTEELMALLSDSQLESFESQLESGDILSSETLQNAIAEPWWLTSSPDSDGSSFIQDLDTQQVIDNSSTATRGIAKQPPVIADLAPFSKLTTAQPHPSLPFNLVELLCVYSIVWRHFNGEWGHSDDATAENDYCDNEARSFLCELSLLLKDGGNTSFGYDGVESAVFGVWDRVIRMNNVLLDPATKTSIAPAKQVLTLLLNDLSQLLSSQKKTVSALSHLHSLFNNNSNEKSDKKKNKEERNLNLRISRKILFYTCFAGSANDATFGILREQTARCTFEKQALDMNDAIHEVDPGSVDAAREQVLQRMQKEVDSKRTLIQEL